MGAPGAIRIGTTPFSGWMLYQATKASFSFLVFILCVFVLQYICVPHAMMDREPQNKLVCYSFI